ncbi:MAG: polyprenyl diphosphate synthase [Opitutales bacterium]
MVKSAISNAEQKARHIAIIMDGNGRWARSRGYPRVEGHRRGVQRVRETIRAMPALGISHLTLFTFSIENWRRPGTEVSALMELLSESLDLYVNELIEGQFRLRVLGRMAELPQHVRERLERAMSATAQFTDRNVMIALNYGSRSEVIDAVKAYARDVQAGRANPDSLDWQDFSQYLYTCSIPDPDLLIRTSGESRLSNFLLLQLAYAELYFTPVAWPDFDERELQRALHDYEARERRFGLTGEQVGVNADETVLQD